jgi:diguanylate cyclase (GGDEF)-like protein
MYSTLQNDSVRRYTILGFSLLLTLMLIMSVIALSQLHSVNQNLNKVVVVTNTKIGSAYLMRDAIRQRALSLRNARLTKDPFERDMHAMDFMKVAGQYREARDKLLTVDMDEKEQQIQNQLSELTKASQPYNDRAMEHLTQDSNQQIIDEELLKAAEMQNKVLSLLDQLIQLEEEYAENSRKISQHNYENTQYTMIILMILIFVLGIVVAVYIVRMTTRKTEHIKYQACHDSLTGLINRREFEIRLDMAIHTARSERISHTLLYLDLDEFKIINDSSGHIAGDCLLKSLPDVFHRVVRKSDTVARLGGDEFAIILHDCDIEKAEILANTLKDAMADYSFTWENRHYTIGASIGLVTIDEDSNDSSTLLKYADIACYAAKENGKNRTYTFRFEDINILRRHGEMQWASILKDALSNNQLQIFLQPIKASAVGKIHHKRYEVLIRLKGEDGEIIEPRKFIPAAERYHMMPEVDRWVIDRLFSLCPANEYDQSEKPLLCVNLSGDSLNDQDFIDHLESRLTDNPKLAAHLCFEIKESAIMQRLQHMDNIISRLKKHGCRISIDDFGAGISSLYYLKNLEVDYVKIQGSFVRNMVSDNVKHDLILAATQFCHKLGIDTIAEFVENDATLDAVRKLGIDYAQGYAIGKPLPCDKYLNPIDSTPGNNNRITTSNGD